MEWIQGIRKQLGGGTELGIQKGVRQAIQLACLG